MITISLSAGQRLGPFAILARIGAGGMGEVWRARDTRLERTVAIKVLPSHLSSDPQIKQRFEREARAISSLSHPHICTLHDIGEQDGFSYLVMEYLEGQTLAERLSKGALPLEEALRYATEIGDALDRAHRSGIVHRDLKPGNIMLTKGGVKLLDFGLAKFSSVAAEVTRLTSSQSQIGNRKSEIESEPPHVGCYGAKEGLSGEVTQKESELTKAGTILGTLSYMAPEQLEGKQADARTDLFAFGVVLYEMVTGKKAFTGKSQASLIAAILEHEPEPISKLQPMSPPAFERVVKRCLAKEPDARWQTALDLLEELKWIAEGGSQAGVPVPMIARRKERERFAWMAASLFALIAVVTTFLYLTRPVVVERVIRFPVEPPENTVVHSFALSPDGSRLAFTAREASGQSALWIRSLDSLLAERLPKTEGASYPFWSPDSTSIAFFAESKLKRIHATDALKTVGEPFTVADQVRSSPLAFLGSFSASETGVLAFDTGAAESSSQLVWFDRQGQQHATVGDRSIQTTINLSPDERQLVVCVKDAVKQTLDFWVYDLLRGVPTKFTFDGSSKAVAVWSPDGSRIVFNSFRNGAYNLYQKAVGGIESEETLLVSKLHQYPNSWSPDGKHILCATLGDPGRKVDLWVLPLEGDRKEYLFRGTKNNERAPQFSPDGRWVAYMSDESEKYEIYVVSFPEGMAKKRVSTGGGTQPRWRRDGKELFYLAPDNKLMAVEVQTKDTTVEVNSPSPLFPMRPACPFSSYDVSRDGQHFIVNTALESTNSSPIIVVVNWTAELKKK